MSVPAGFHEHASGLVVPEAIARKRIVLTKQEWRIYEQAIRLHRRLGLDVKMACAKKGCDRLEHVPQADGSVLLRCGCTDRVFSKAF